MTDRQEQDEIASEFMRLRDEELEAAPSFEALSKRRAPAKRLFSIPRLVFLSAVLTALLAALLLFEPTPVDTQIERGVEPPVEVQLALTQELPTDFLLDTPVLELASTTPHFELTIPSYDPPEERR